MITTNNRAIYFLFFVGVFNIFYNGTLPIHFDEAYYWYMSKNLDFSFYDVPYVLPYMIRFFTELFGDDVWAIRLVAVFSMSIAGWYIYLLTKEIYDEKTAFTALIIITLLPIVQVGYTITTTDAPFMMFWSTGLYYGYRAIFYDTNRDYILFGVMVGFGMASKYSMVLLVAGLVLYLLFYKRHLLFSKKVIFALIAGLICFFPVMWWNYLNEWSSIIRRYQFGSTSTFEIHPKHIKDYFISLVLIVTPVFFLYFVIEFFKKTKISEKEKYLLFLGLFFLGYFLYKAFFKSMAPNWYAPGAYVLFPFIAYRLVTQNHIKWKLIGFGFSLLLLFVFKFPDLLHLPPKANGMSKLMGFKEGVEEMIKIIPQNALVCGDYYDTTSLFRYHTREQDYTVIAPLTPQRTTDIDFWFNYKDFQGKTCYVFADGNFDKQEQCSKVIKIGSYTYKNPKYSSKKFNYYKCEGLKTETIGHL